jgi:hypothetical protein
MFMAASVLRIADVGQIAGMAAARSHPFAGMTRIRFDGSGDYANLSR